MPLLPPRDLATQAFNLVYHVPGLTFSDVASWDFKRRQLWLDLLEKQREVEKEEIEKINRKQ
jgi:hypothetical protein